MNCPSRTDEPEGTGFNQNPNFLAGDLTTRNDLNGIANSRVLRRNATMDVIIGDVVEDDLRDFRDQQKETAVTATALTSATGQVQVPGMTIFDAVEDSGEDRGVRGRVRVQWPRTLFMRSRKVMMKFGKFLGPGFMVCAL
jgi:metal iron transporter